MELPPNSFSDKKSKFTEIFPNVESEADKAYRIFESGLGLVPAVGSTAVSIFKTLVTNPIQLRAEKWIKEVETRILELEERGVLDISLLKNRPEVSAILLRLIQEVEITSQQEKLNFLSNFAVNTTLPKDIEIDEQFILTNMLTALTPSHIKVLELYNTPQKFHHNFVKICEKSYIPSSGSLGHILNYNSVSEELTDIMNIERQSCPINEKSPIDEYYWSTIFRQLNVFNLIEVHDYKYCGSFYFKPYGRSVELQVNLKCRATRLGSNLIEMLSLST